MRSRWWQAVSTVGIVGGIGFVTLAIIEDLGLLVQAAIPFAGAALTLRGRLAGVILVGAYCLLEVVFVPFYDRNSATDWIAQVSAWVVGAIGLVAVTGYSVSVVASRTRLERLKCTESGATHRPPR